MVAPILESSPSADHISHACPFQRSNFYNILKLTSANATTPVHPAPSFSHNFTIIDENNAIPEGMNVKDVKQVVSIYKILVESLNGELNDANLVPLQKQFMDRNMAALKFVCTILGIKLMLTYGTLTRIYKKDLVSELIKWVSCICFSISHHY